jgi:hypothetical protein
MKNVSIYRRKSSSSYVVQYTDENGLRKHISTRSSSKSEALKFLANLKNELKTPKSKPCSISEFTTDFLLYAATQLRPATVQIHKYALGLLLDCLGNVAMRTITPRHVDKWKAV